MLSAVLVCDLGMILRNQRTLCLLTVGQTAHAKTTRIQTHHRCTRFSVLGEKTYGDPEFRVTEDVISHYYYIQVTMKKIGVGVFF